MVKEGGGVAFVERTKNIPTWQGGMEQPGVHDKRDTITCNPSSSWGENGVKRELKRAAVVPEPRVVVVKDRDWWDASGVVISARVARRQNYAKGYLKFSLSTTFPNTTPQRLGIRD